MIDKRILQEIKRVDTLYFLKVIAAAIVAVTFIILQAKYIAEILNDIFILHTTFNQTIPLFITLAIVIIVKMAILFYYDYYHKKMGIHVKQGFRNQIFHALILNGLSNIRRKKAATLVTQVQDGAEEIEPYVSEFIPQMIFVAVSTPLVLIFVFRHDWLSGVIMICTGPLIPFFMVMIGRMAKQAQNKQWKALQEINAYFLDILHGFTTLKIFGQSEKQGERVGEVSEMFRVRTMNVLRISFISAFVLEFMATISTAIVAVTLGLRLLYGHMGFEVAFLMLLLCPEYYQPIRTLGLKFHASLSGKTALTALTPIIESGKGIPLEKECGYKENSFEKLEIQIDNFVYEKEPLSDNEAEKRLHENQEDSESPFALCNINIEVLKGEKVALTGVSGSGKTTLIAILMNLISNYQGSICVDSINIKALEEGEWNRYFAYVPQHPALFKESLYHNLTLGNVNAPLAFIHEIIEKVGLTSVVNRLPHGLETLLAEGGQFLSGGEIQLIAIARALIKNTPLIIMDEPTSALDAVTESKISTIIQHALKDKTVITIAHRLATLQSADRVLYLKQGCVVESGKVETLLEKKGEYYTMVEETKRLWAL